MDNKDKVRQIHTGLYSNVAKEIIDSVIGQLSDGKWENSPAMEKWWRFANCKRAANGEVLIEVSTEPCQSVYHSKWLHNGFYGMSDDEVKRKFAGWIKILVKDEMRDEKTGNQWKRDSEMKLDYLSYDENVTVADAYLVYETLLERDNQRKYLNDTVLKVVGKQLSDEATKVNEEKERQIAEKRAHRDMLLKQLKDKKDEDIKQLEAKYREDYSEIIKQYQKWIDGIKAA